MVLWQGNLISNTSMGKYGNYVLCETEFYLLHGVMENWFCYIIFMKTTQKTPKREIEKAKKEFADFLQNMEE